MGNSVVIREFGVLRRGGDERSLDVASLAAADWDWLLLRGGQMSEDGPGLLRPQFRGGHRVLQVSNYVGLLELPSGTVLEILPKIAEQETATDARRQFMKMLVRVDELPSRRFDDTDLKTFSRPLLEILIGRFLTVAQHLVNRGLRSDYILIASEEQYIKGKIRMSAAVRQLPHQRSRVPIEYDDYLLERPENRLLHWSIDRVYHWSRDNSHRIHARKLLILLAPIPKSVDPIADLKDWQDDRHMQHYRPVKPWIELIVAGLSPWIQRGNRRGISLLFPMEKLFERYVYQVLRHQLETGYAMAYQSRSSWLAHHRGKGWFNLQPDMAVKHGHDLLCVLDAKWKMLDENASDRKNKYGISQSDIYQLFAYAKQCLPEGGQVFLIYPASERFSAPLPSFTFGEDHTLWVVPFDLRHDSLIPGAWLEYCEWHPTVAALAV